VAGNISNDIEKFVCKTWHGQTQHQKVIGLQNLDEESKLNRHFKQIIERFNRTYKYHVRADSGFNPLQLH